MAFAQAFSRSAALALALLMCSALSSAQTFPCPPQASSLASAPSSSSPAVAGGYSNIALDNLDRATLETIRDVTNASFVEWVEQDNNITLCDDINNLVNPVEFAVVQVCSQVVAGTNYGIRFIAQYSCIVDDDLLAQDNLVLNSVVYVPLPISGQNDEPQVQDVWVDTDVPVEQVEIPVEIIAAGPSSGDDDGSSDSDNNDGASDSSDDNVLASNPTPSPPPYTLEGL